MSLSLQKQALNVNQILNATENLESTVFYFFLHYFLIGCIYFLYSL